MQGLNPDSPDYEVSALPTELQPTRRPSCSPRTPQGHSDPLLTVYIPNTTNFLKHSDPTHSYLNQVATITRQTLFDLSSSSHSLLSNPPVGNFDVLGQTGASIQQKFQTAIDLTSIRYPSRPTSRTCWYWKITAIQVVTLEFTQYATSSMTWTGERATYPGFISWIEILA